MLKITSTSPDPDGAGPVAPFTSVQTFNPLTGRPVSTSDQNGLVTTGTYDALGRATSLRMPQHQNTDKPRSAESAEAEARDSPQAPRPNSGAARASLGTPRGSGQRSPSSIAEECGHAASGHHRE